MYTHTVVVLRYIYGVYDTGFVGLHVRKCIRLYVRPVDRYTICTGHLGLVHFVCTHLATFGVRQLQVNPRITVVGSWDWTLFLGASSIDSLVCAAYGACVTNLWACVAPLSVVTI